MTARLVAITMSLILAAGASGAAEPVVDYARDVRPILANHCWACHGPDEKAREADLRLDSREGATAKRDGKPAVVPGSAPASALVARIESTNAKRVMPPPASKKPLTDAQKKLLRRWVEQGAAYTGHWAFVPPRRPILPPVKDVTWPRNGIDHFILARLEREGLRPAAEAGKATLLRRVTLDLTGLPPTPQELDAFLADTSADAYHKVVDRLLHSPRFGEKLAMQWLDAARYADTNGYNNDEERTMWLWRDWVINAFNAGMPYDRFVTEQLAGDLLPGPSTQQLIATAFNRNHVLTTEGGIFEEEYRVEYVADRVHTTATVFMGLTLQCARCHDHKFDPLSQREYYQFFAFFNNLPERVVQYNKGGLSEPFIKVPTAQQQARLEALRRERAASERKLPRNDAAKLVLGTSGYRGLQRTMLEIDRQIDEIDKTLTAVMIMRDLPTPRQTHVLTRGQYDQPAEKVSAGTPVSLTVLPRHVPQNRLGLARWLMQPTHPLTARVAVNRWWEMLFGTGIVETAEDFGTQGALPSHPELLDWLALEFMGEQPAATGAAGTGNPWNIKGLLRTIVTSATYRQSSHASPHLRERDPSNRLLGRGPRVRLPAETIRDCALAAAGSLRDRVGGPSVKPYQPPGLWEDVSVERRYSYVPDKGEGLYRRSMYTFWRRTCPPPAMTAFDAPDREFCLMRRARTNTPLQALVLLNDPTYLEAARKLAERVLRESTADEDRLRQLHRLILSRSPDAVELKVLLGLHRSAVEHFRRAPAQAHKLLAIGESPPSASGVAEANLAAWTTIASVMLNLDEAITKN